MSRATSKCPSGYIAYLDPTAEKPDREAEVETAACSRNLHGITRRAYAAAMQQVTSADGTRIAYESLGDGAPLILVGGALCDRRARTAGLPLAKLLAARHRVICYDRRGRGDSTDQEAYAVEHEVEDLAALLSVCGGTAGVYGHSSGAILALLGAHSGLAISKLALYEPPLVLSSDRDALPARLVEDLHELTRQDRRSEAVELFFTRAVGIPERAVAAMKSAPYWPSLTALSHTLSYDARLAQDPLAVLRRAIALDVPALVVAGARSPSWMRYAATRLAQALPRAEHLELADQTHDVDPEKLAPELLRFFGEP
jgi:pimeloyl-ACP methyl ester carboxylesterase